MDVTCRYRSAKPNNDQSVEKIGVRASPTKTEIKVKGGDHVNCNGVFRDVSGSFDNMTTSMEFLAIKEVPADVPIGIIEMEKLQTNLDLGWQFAQFKIEERNLELLYSRKPAFLMKNKEIVPTKTLRRIRALSMKK